MDTTELTDWLDRQIDDARRDRERLLEAVEALGSEIARLEKSRQTVNELITKVTRASQLRAVTEPRIEQQATPTTPNVDEPEFAIAWPLDEQLGAGRKARKPKALARLKFAAADWYLSTLREIEAFDGLTLANLGVELAVDGVIQNLASSFDAAIFALTSTIERSAEIPKERRTAAQSANWQRVFAEAKFLGIDLACGLSISDALIGEHSPEPKGWLAQLLVLRNVASRRDLLLQDPSTTEGALFIDLPVEGPQPLLDYLSARRDLIEELLETMFHDIAAIKASGSYLDGADLLRRRAAQGLDTLFPISPLDTAR